MGHQSVVTDLKQKQKHHLHLRSTDTFADHHYQDGISDFGPHIESSDCTGQLAAFAAQPQHLFLRPCILIFFGTRVQLQLKTGLGCRTE